jgi:hypothetical protein
MCDKHRFFFEFDKAFTHQLIEKFEASPAHRLTEDVAPPEKGVYALYRRGRIVYAGKALDTTLKRRLAEHARKVMSRRNISVSEMTCRFLIIDSDWFVRAVASCSDWVPHTSQELPFAYRASRNVSNLFSSASEGEPRIVPSPRYSPADAGCDSERETAQEVEPRLED